MAEGKVLGTNTLCLQAIDFAEFTFPRSSNPAPGSEHNIGKFRNVDRPSLAMAGWAHSGRNVMTVETWLAFVATCAALVAIPGPTVLLVLSYALGQGWRAALPMAIGVAPRDFTAMSLSVLGIGALLMASTTVFTIVKWIGAAYLVYLGIKLFRAGGTLNAEPKTDASSYLKMGAHAWLVTSLNPKSVLFFVAFFPQFINPHSAFWPQVLTLQCTFLVIALTSVLAYAYFASRARGLVRSERVIRAVNRTGGSLLVGAGIASAAIR